MKKVLIFLLTLLLLCSLVSCASMNKEGVYDLNAELGEVTPGGVVPGGSSSKGDAAEMSPFKDPSCGDYGEGFFDSAVEGGMVAGDPMNGGNGISAGTLTGAELNDLSYWKEYLESLSGENFRKLAGQWKLSAANRIHVTVKNSAGEPVAGAGAKLYNLSGDTLFSAISDCDGNAYLYYNIRGNQDAIGEVVVSSGTEETRFTPDGAGDYEVTMSGDNNVTSLDLLLMIDTTGSMGDELEYLKTELANVVSRVYENCQVDIRVSVNFYRDKGDTYIVRSNPFYQDLETSLSILSSQTANGGGDYPEAVHTALADAVDAHQWRENSTKLVLLVLDAPPHLEEDVCDSLYGSLTSAADQGIRIIPVASSGVDDTCDYLFRTFAALTGGTYTYLTDHSGISSGSHADPDTTVQATVEYLNDLLVRVISGYCGVKIDKKPLGEQPIPVCPPIPIAPGTVPEGFSFSITWGVYGISSYDSATGKLVKTTDASHPEDYVTNLVLTREQLAMIYTIISELCPENYPAVYDPNDEGTYSSPHTKLELTICFDGKISTSTTCPEVYYLITNEKGTCFVDACNRIAKILTSTEEWNALPDYEFFYE